MIYRLIVLLLITAIVGAVSAGIWLLRVDGLCRPDEVCVREWLSATSGWAAVIAAVPTILYLSKQVRDADRHQKTSFAIQMRRHAILATRTLDIAYTAIAMIDLYLKHVPEGEAGDIRSFDRETVDGILHHLRGTTLSAFEGEIANPTGVPAYGTSLIVEKGYRGDDRAALVAPEIARSFFENIARQAESYLSEVKNITGRV